MSLERSAISRRDCHPSATLRAGSPPAGGFAITRRCGYSSDCYDQVHHLGLHQALEIGVAELDQLGVGPGVEGDLLVLGQAGGHVDLHTVQDPERGHGADLAIGEQVLELPLGGQAGLALPVISRSNGRSTRSVAGRTAMAMSPSTLIMTVLANCLPGMWAEAAISEAVKNWEWVQVVYLTFSVSRNSFSFLAGMAASLVVGYAKPVLRCSIMNPGAGWKRKYR